MLGQLAKQVESFTWEAQRSNTALVCVAQPLESRSSANDINKQQIVGHANGTLKLLSERNKSTINKLNARGPRKWPEANGPESANSRVGKTKKTMTTTKTTTTTTKSDEPPAQLGGRRNSGNKMDGLLVLVAGVRTWFSLQ